MALINFPLLYIPDPDLGRPLFAGKIYVGQPDTDPTIPANQKQLRVVQEDGTLVNISQPMVLSSGGVPVYDGSPVRLDVEGDYSLKILSRLDSQVYYISNVYDGEPIIFDDLQQYIPAEFATVSSMISANPINSLGTINWSDYLGREVSTVVNNTTSNEGGAQYVIVNVNPGNLSTLVGGIWVGANHDLGGGFYAKLNTNSPSIFNFGKVKSVDSDAVIDAAINYAVAKGIYIDIAGDTIVYTGALDYTRLIGSGSLTTDTNEYSPVKVQSKSSNVGGTWGTFSEELGGSVSDALRISLMGCSYVIYNYYGRLDSERVSSALVDFENLSRYGIGVILGVENTKSTVDRTARANLFKDVPNLIGWYVFDEPLTNGVSKAEQVAAISALRAVKDLPMYTSEHGDVFPTAALPVGYDFVFVDIYYQAVNANAGLLTETQVLMWYASALRSVLCNYNEQQIIPIYGTYGSVVVPLIDEAEMYKSLYNKKRLMGAGCFFLYSADITAPGLFGTKNTAQLERVAKRIIMAPVGEKTFKSITVGSVDATYGPTQNQVRSTWANFIGHTSTGTLKYDAIAARFGMFLNAGQFAVIDLGVVAKSIRIYGRFFNFGSPASTTTTWDYLVPHNSLLNASVGEVVGTQVVVTSGSGSVTFGIVLLDIKSRYLIINTAAYTAWNVLTGFDTFHISIIK